MWLLGTTALVLGLLAVMTDAGVVAGDDQPTPSSSDIMKKSHGKGGLRASLQKGLKANPVDWDKTQKDAKEYADLAAALGKNAPPKGEKASWDKLTKAFADTVKEVSTAADKKDAAATQSALGKINQQTCQSCHTAHRG
jgi:cytochrome c556